MNGARMWNVGEIKQDEKIDSGKFRKYSGNDDIKYRGNYHKGVDCVGKGNPMFISSNQYVPLDEVGGSWLKEALNLQFTVCIFRAKPSGTKGLM